LNRSPLARDDEIRARLERILAATGWFDRPQVTVDEGVVFLEGTADTDEYRQWAGKLATSTQDVVAVVNKMDVAQPVVWDVRPAFEGLRDLWRGLLGFLPYLGFGMLILLATFAAARLTRNLSRRVFARSVEVPLLREVVARALALVVFLIGLYIVLRVSGLTRLALTVVGGTGLIGLVIGIAFRDIAENFLASILLSVQRPFRSGDVVEIADVYGVVERLNVRTTIIMTFDGNHAQIPNSTVYKSVIRNYTSNPARRDDFVIGVGYEASIGQAQELALDILAQHPAVLGDPEPWVLVDRLGAATVDMRVYYWIDGTRHAPPKVRSSVIRLVKQAFEQAGIAMPDSAREVLFPRGVPIRIVEDTRNGQDGAGPPVERPRQTERTQEPVISRAEDRLDSDTAQIEKQARQSLPPEAGANLLAENPGS
jgi:small-conductance mechanosensitive channel